jgi:uncharacterized protein
MALDDPWHYARPEQAAHYTGLLADAPRRPLALFGPRQIGKTHFLVHDLREAAEARHWEPVYADLWGAPDPLTAINTALATTLRRVATQTGRTPVTSVSGLGLSVGMAAPAPLARPDDQAALLATQFAELLRLQAHKPALLMLDEAQTLVKPGAGDAAMKAIRALFNSHPGSVLLIFTGSSKTQLMSLVGDHSKTAFKLAAHMDFPSMGIGFVSFVAQRVKAITGREVAIAELDWAFGQLLFRPGELIDFVRFLITETPGSDLRDALDAFKARSRPDLAFAERYAACSALQRTVLIEVAMAQKLFSRETRERMASRMGQTTALPPASVHNALAQLETQGVLAKSEARGQYMFEDEHLKTWIVEVARNQPRPGAAG